MSHGTLRATRCIAATLIFTLTACGDSVGVPPATTVLSAAEGPTIPWNLVGRELIASRAVGSPTAQIRIMTYLSVAQYNAIVAAEDAATASPAAAVAGASLVVLKAFFPLDSAMLDEKLRAQKATSPWPEEPVKDVAAGEVIGRTIGAQVTAYAATDNTTLTTRPANPGGPGNWTGVNSLRGFHGSRTFALTSGDQFRPAAPPTFGSAEFTAALTEVRSLTNALTETQRKLVEDWAPRAGAYLNSLAAEIALKGGRSDRDAARMLALANMSGFDVANACFEAKFAYYYIRPTQADPQVKLATALPNHPSYPSGHSCFTAAYATAIASVVPEEAARLNALVLEAGESRILGGLHFRFDCLAGQALGRQVAEQVVRVTGTGRGAIALD